MVVGVVTGCGIGLTNKNLLAPGLGYIKQSTMIDKLSLRLWEGGSCVNIIMVLSMTLTPL